MRFFTMPIAALLVTLSLHAEARSDRPDRMAVRHSQTLAAVDRQLPASSRGSVVQIGDGHFARRPSDGLLYGVFADGTFGMARGWGTQIYTRNSKKAWKPTSPADLFHLELETIHYDGLARESAQAPAPGLSRRLFRFETLLWATDRTNLDGSSRRIVKSCCTQWGPSTAMAWSGPPPAGGRGPRLGILYRDDDGRFIRGDRLLTKQLAKLTALLSSTQKP
jgi:hypothetical protein